MFKTLELTEGQDSRIRPLAVSLCSRNYTVSLHNNSFASKCVALQDCCRLKVYNCSRRRTVRSSPSASAECPELSPMDPAFPYLVSDYGKSIWRMLLMLSVANNFWGKDDAGVQPLLERMQNAKVTCDELKAFYNSTYQSATPNQILGSQVSSSGCDRG